MNRLTVIADNSLPEKAVSDSRQACLQLAEATGSEVQFSLVKEEAFSDVQTFLRANVEPNQSVLFTPAAAISDAPPNAVMSSAPFVYTEDGRPDWGKMWESFCELALYGGPPHRGPKEALQAPANAPAAEANNAIIEEIRRGIWETTALYSEPAEPGWIAVTCDSRKMAAWLCACIILENVDARSDEDRLYLPASPTFTIKDEVKSVITVIAKTYHYWQAHVTAQAKA